MPFSRIYRVSAQLDGFWDGGWVWGTGGEKSADFWRMWIMAMLRHGLDGG
jgi:hypothetical protein